MLMPNPLSQVFKAKWTKSLQKWSLILASRNSLKRERKIERILDSKSSIMGLVVQQLDNNLVVQQLDNNQRPRERKWLRTPQLMVEIPKLQDGPTASFRLPCNSRWLKMAHLMEHTAEVRHRDKSLKEMAEQQ
jgi:hypothetical protein